MNKFVKYLLFIGSCGGYTLTWGPKCSGPKVVLLTLLNLIVQQFHRKCPVCPQAKQMSLNEACLKPRIELATPQGRVGSKPGQTMNVAVASGNAMEGLYSIKGTQKRALLN